MFSIFGTPPMETDGGTVGVLKPCGGSEGGGVGNEVVRTGGIGDTGSSKLEEKIDVVLQILTMLESTMSSAESVHQKNKTDYLSKITQLELEIDKLRREMSVDEDKYREEAKILGGCIQVYMASENILRTVEERSQDDTIVLPEVDSKTENLIDRYLGENQNDWQRLKCQRERLNHDTQQRRYQKDLLVRRFKIGIPVTTANQFNQRAVGAANALNTFRGKKFVAGNQAYAIERCVAMTCYENDYAAVNYVENNYSRVLGDVIRKQYNCSEAALVINELAAGEEFDRASLMETTIHVQPKPKENSDFSSPGTPKRITLYQFDDRSPRRQSQVTTFNVETAAIADVNDDNNLAFNDSEVSNLVSPQVFTCQVQAQSSKELFPAFNHNTKLSQIQQPEQPQISAKTSELLNSFIGLDLDDGNILNEITQSNNKLVPDHNFSARTGQSTADSLQQPPKPKSSSQANMGPSEENDDKEIDGVVLREWARFLVEEKGINCFTETQKEFLNSFKLQGDILYKGVKNAGKTTATILGVVNQLSSDLFKPQALVVTPNTRTSKLIRNMANIEAGRHMIICKRFEELVGQKDKSKKIFKRPPCQVVVGSAEEMCDLASKGLVNTELINYLVLYKVDEVVGPESIRKSIFKNIRKLLYALSATIKVIVVCRTNMKMDKEMQELCDSKLRNKIIFEEEIDIEGFLNGRRRIKSGDKNLDCVKQDSSQPLIKSVIPQENKIRSDSSKPKSKPPCYQVDEPNEGSEIISKDVRKQVRCRTFIPLDAVQILGINVGRHSLYKESDQIEVAHFYANIESGGDYSKADVISMLDLEEDKAVIFCNSIDKTEWLSTILRQKHLWPQVLHEDVPSKDQRVILENFRQGSFCRVLICTDFLLSISFASADVVLNFDLPETQTRYLNRTAFAFRQINCSNPNDDNSITQPERKGIVVSLITEDEMQFFNDLERDIGIKVQNCED